MRHRLPRVRLTYANVLSTVAVFIALGGASYAAVTLPRNSVGPAQIRPGAVSLSKLGAALGSNSVSVERSQPVTGGASCSGGANGVPAPCPPPKAAAIASTTIKTKQRANLLVFATGVASNPTKGGPAATLQLTASVDHSSLATPVSVSSIAPGAEQSPVLISTHRNVPPGNHVVALNALASQGPVNMLFTQLTVVAVPPGP